MGCVSDKPAPPKKTKDALVTIKAALLIQRWYRRHRARQELRRCYTWYIFQNLEYAAESDQVELYKFYNDLLTHMPNVVLGGRTSLSNRSTTSSGEFSLDDFDSEADSRVGFNLKFPMTEKDVQNLIDLFRKKKDNQLPAKQVAQILREATSRLHKLPNLNVASTANSRQITIIGDLHGKLDDLIVIFYKNGLPSMANPYVFNGDFVDRGKKSLEVYLLLLSCFLVFPGAVFLNRGNHEDSVMNARYGFIKEVKEKYKKNGDKLLSLCDETFRWLPLGTVINNRILVVHGGISNTTNLDMIKSMDRSRYISILRPAVQQNEAAETLAINQQEWKQVFDITWSDPQNKNGCIPNELRGAGTYFGPDISNSFLQKYKLKYLVRSHECKVDGYEFTHNDQVITIFSASNYYAHGSNKGAYLKFDAQLQPQFVQYISAASKTKDLTFQQKVGLVENSALRELGGHLCDYRDDLEEEFKKRDPQNTGLIDVSVWCDCMESITHLGLPWRLLRRQLAPMQDAKTLKVRYASTIELLDSAVMLEAQAAETSVVESLYTNKSSLEAIFHILDSDHSGFISLEEFGEAIDLLQKHLPNSSTREDLLKMCKMMDINNDGFVDLNEFLEAFRLSEAGLKKKPNKKSPSGDKSVQRASLQIAKAAQYNNSLSKETDIDPTDYEARTLGPSDKDSNENENEIIIKYQETILENILKNYLFEFNIRIFVTIKVCVKI